MDFYFGRNSGNSLRVALGLLESGTAFEPRQLDVKGGQNQKPPYLGVNPMGKVPGLVDGQFALWESNAINWYLAEKRPAAKLLPESLEARAAVQRWMFFQAAHLTSPACPSRTASSAPVVASHVRAVRSSDTVARRVP